MIDNFEKESGFADADLSAEGRWLRAVLRGEAPPAAWSAAAIAPPAAAEAYDSVR